MTLDEIKNKKSTAPELIKPGAHAGIISKIKAQQAKSNGAMMLVPTIQGLDKTVIGNAFLAVHPDLSDIKIKPHDFWLEQSLKTTIEILETNGKDLTKIKDIKSLGRALLGCDVVALVSVETTESGTRVNIDSLFGKGHQPEPTEPLMEFSIEDEKADETESS